MARSGGRVVAREGSRHAERSLADTGPMHAPAEPLRLVVGMSRGGTTALTVALNEDPRVAAFGETAFWGRLWVPPEAGGRYGVAQIRLIASRLRGMRCVPFGDDGLVQDGLTLGAAMADAIEAMPAPSSPGEVFRAMGRAVAAACGRSVFVEKTPHHLMHLDRIFAHDPEARVVVMLRAPEQFLRSYKHQGDRKPEPARSNFHRLYHPMVAAMICRGSLRAAAHAVRSHAGRVRISDIEAIRRDPATELGAIRTHLRLPSFEDAAIKQVNSSFEGEGRSSKDGSTSLRAVERTWLALLCGRPARSLGFATPSLGWGVLAIPWSIAMLLPWFLRNRAMLGGMDRGGIRGLLRRWARI